MAETVVWKDAFGSWWAMNNTAALSHLPWLQQIESACGAGYQQGCADTNATAIADLRYDVEQIRQILEDEKPK